jgi:hypothetical protein
MQEDKKTDDLHGRDWRVEGRTREREVNEQRHEVVVVVRRMDSNGFRENSTRWAPPPRVCLCVSACVWKKARNTILAFCDQEKKRSRAPERRRRRRRRERKNKRRRKETKKLVMSTLMSGRVFDITRTASFAFRTVGFGMLT